MHWKPPPLLCSASCATECTTMAKQAPSHASPWLILHVPHPNATLPMPPRGQNQNPSTHFAEPLPIQPQPPTGPSPPSQLGGGEGAPRSILKPILGVVGGQTHSPPGPQEAGVSPSQGSTQSPPPPKPTTPISKGHSPHLSSSPCLPGALPSSWCGTGTLWGLGVGWEGGGQRGVGGGKGEGRVCARVCVSSPVRCSRAVQAQGGERWACRGGLAGFLETSRKPHARDTRTPTLKPLHTPRERYAHARAGMRARAERHPPRAHVNHPTPRRRDPRRTRARGTCRRARASAYDPCPPWPQPQGQPPRARAAAPEPGPTWRSPLLGPWGGGCGAAPRRVPEPLRRRRVDA